MATCSSILAWEIPWTVKLGGLYSPRGHKRAGHDLITTLCKGINKCLFFFFLFFLYLSFFSFFPKDCYINIVRKYFIFHPTI